MCFKTILWDIVFCDVKPDFLISADFYRDFPSVLDKRARFPKVSYPSDDTEAIIGSYIRSVPPAVIFTWSIYCK